jgi:hypothetical protein
VHRQGNLLELVDELRPACGLPSRLHGRQKQGDQDGDHHQQLD